MPAPDRPHIVTRYLNNGEMQKEAKGIGGKLCEAALMPYMTRHGKFVSTPTAEFNEPSYLEREQEGGERATA